MLLLLLLLLLVVVVVVVVMVVLLLLLWPLSLSLEIGLVKEVEQFHRGEWEWFR